ncbi:MAG: hypothetical protein L0Z55_10495 [Planctomycetes bacterium]|nr:hypothetical protein [Planctomycetota bacterium]
MMRLLSSDRRAATGLPRWRGPRPSLLVLAALLFLPVALRAGDSADDLKGELAKKIKAGQVTAAIEIAERLVDMNSPEAMNAVLDLFVRADWPDLETAVMTKVGKLQDGPAFRRACELASDHKDYRAQILLTLALAMRSEQEAFTAIVVNLFDPMDEVVRAALEAVRRRDTLHAVEHLIEALAQQEARGKQGSMMVLAIRELLTELTGEDLELAQEWKTFWGPRKTTFQRPARGKERKEITSVDKKAPKLFTEEILAKKVLFLLDISGSMLIKDPLPEEGGDGRTPGEDDGPTTGVVDRKKGKKKQPEPNQDDIPEARMRLRRVQAELVRVLEELPADIDFNIITFNHKIGCFREGGLIPANNANKAQAIQFVKGFNPEGETHTDEALDAAFKLSAVTVIYLLSDGAPRRGDKLLDTKPIYDFILRENRFRRIRINTIGFMQAGGNLKEFLQKVARYTAGKYVELR